MSMSNVQDQMDKLKPGELSASCDACNVWLTPAGTDSAGLSAAIKEHRKAHGGEEVHPIKGEGATQVRYPMTVLFKCAGKVGS